LENMPAEVLCPESTSATGSGTGALSLLRRVKALVLLGGSVRPTPLVLGTGRSVLELPLESNLSLLGHWCAQAADLAERSGRAPLPVSLVLPSRAAAPVLHSKNPRLDLRVERDRTEYRGTGGVLRDLFVGHDRKDLLLVASGSQVLLEPLFDLAAALIAAGGDLSFLSHADGTPVSLMLISCACLHKIPPVGYVDMKEQGIPAIARSHLVKVLRRDRVVALPVRTLSDYIAALRAHHGRGRRVVDDPFAESWSPAFSVVEDRGAVSSGASLHDSVVLRGGSVEENSFLVRSVVCPGGSVRDGRVICDSLVTA
jgi:hypothetical protein